GQDDFTIHQAGESDPGSFTSKPWWAQAIVLAAGVTMNMVLALVVLTVAFATGTTASTGDVRVRSVAANSPAQNAGIQVGDIVRSIDGRQITRANDLVSYVTSRARLHPDQEVTLEIERNGRPLQPITAIPRAEPPEGEGPLGIGLEEVQGAKTLALPDAFREALSLSGQVVVQIAELPGQLLAPRAATGGPTVGGPIEIFRITGQVAQSGIPTFLNLVGVLSVDLAVLNIVSFPARDLRGLSATNGRRVRDGALVRSDQLCRLSDRGRADLLAHGVRTVIDLRNPAEAEKDPDPAWRERDVDYMLIPQQDEQFWSSIAAARTRAERDALVLDHRAEHIVAMARAFAHATPGGVLIHCLAGKDRTGIAVALLLSLVGVDEAQIAAD